MLLRRISVALRKESVDRNTVGCRIPLPVSGSLSARRAWIEMVLPAPQGMTNTVALRKEMTALNGCSSRSPYQ